MIAPSVPTISIQVDEKFGYAGGSTQPAPMVKTVPSSMVTIIQTQSGTLYCAPMIFRTSWAYTLTGFLGARHHSTKSMSWVASMAAGESLTRPPIFLRSEERRVGKE